MTPGIVARRVVSLVTQPFWSPDDLLRELQTTLAALADIESRREKDRERLEQCFGPNDVDQRLWAAREIHYQAEREPYQCKLEQLQRRMRRSLSPGL